MKWSQVLKEIDRHGWRSFLLGVELEHDLKLNWENDGCSWFPDRLIADLTDECAEHDAWYRNHYKLTRAGIPITKWRADRRLRQRVGKKVRKSMGWLGTLGITAKLMYLGVTFGGYKAWRTKV